VDSSTVIPRSSWIRLRQRANLELVFQIERCSGLVEHQERRGLWTGRTRIELRERGSDHDPLFLAAGKRAKWPLGEGGRAR
jgi:hypothetical protein